MRKTFIGFAAAAAIGSAGAGLAADVSEEAAYLKIPTSARSLAMGGAFTAISDDLGSLGVNPGGLGGLAGGAVLATYAKFLPGSGYGFVSVASHSERTGGINAASVRAFTAGGLERTGVNGESLGSFAGSGLALEISHGRNVAPGVNAGVTLRAVRDEIAGQSVWGVAADAGGVATLKSDLPLTVGLALRSVGPALFRSGGSGSDTGEAGVPATFVAAASYSIAAGPAVIVPDLDIGYAFVTGRVKAAIGVDAEVMKMISVRLGWRGGSGGIGDSFASGGITAGFGVSLSGLRFDYAYAPMALGTTHFLTVGAAFPGTKQEMRK